MWYTDIHTGNTSAFIRKGRNKGRQAVRQTRREEETEESQRKASPP